MIGDPSANRELFTGKAGDYSCARPNYPAALYEHLCEICAPAADAAVADVGAGTGLLTEGLLKAGYRVVAIEPNGDMRAVADRLADVYPAYQGVAGSAESLPLPDSSVDLVTAAQAFHWFHPENARAEFLRVLKPDGMVALIWNDRLPGDALNQALDELFREYRGMKSAALAAREERWGMARFFGSGQSNELVWPHEQTLNEAGFLSLIFSRSYSPPRETPPGLTLARRGKMVFEQFARDGRVTIRYRTSATIGRPG